MNLETQCKKYISEIVAMLVKLNYEVAKPTLELFDREVKRNSFDDQLLTALVVVQDQVHRYYVQRFKK